jgi:hypothetical protein
MKALIRKEIRLLVESSGVAVALDTLLPGVALFVVMTAAKGRILASSPAGVDAFALFAIFSFGLSSMFLSLTGPIALLERTTGILDTQLALVGSPRPILAAKVAVLVGLASASVAFWTLVGLGSSRITGAAFVGEGAGGRALLVVAVVFPLSIALLSSVHVLVGTVFPKVASLASLVLFVVTFAVFANLATLSASVTRAAVMDLVAMLVSMAAVLAGVIWFMGLVPRERLLGS